MASASRTLPQVMKLTDAAAARVRDIIAKADKIMVSQTAPSHFAVGERVFHQKFGYGSIIDVEGNKLEIEFEKAGIKRVLDSFVEPAK